MDPSAEDPRPETTEAEKAAPDTAEISVVEENVQDAPPDPPQPLELTEPELTQAAPVPPTPAKRGIAPLWHTILTIAAILGFSYWGADRGAIIASNPIPVIPQSTDSKPAAKPTPEAKPEPKPQPDLKPGQKAKSAPKVDEPPVKTDRVRIIHYALSGIVELLFVAWIALGLRLRRVPFRSLFGKWPRDLNSITVEAGIATLFWIASLAVLLAVALTWQAAQTQIYKFQLKQHEAKHAAQSSSAKGAEPGKSDASSETDSKAPVSPEHQQADMIRKLFEIAPANGIEIAAWALLCLIVGFSEEIIFRGYLQGQSIALLRNVPAGLIVAALVFGAAHGYQGYRGMTIITVYGALFGAIALLRRSLFPGMLAHSWHDFATGMFLALIRATHMLDHAPFN